MGCLPSKPTPMLVTTCTHQASRSYKPYIQRGIAKEYTVDYTYQRNDGKHCYITTNPTKKKAGIAFRRAPAATATVLRYDVTYPDNEERS